MLSSGAMEHGVVERRGGAVEQWSCAVQRSGGPPARLSGAGGGRSVSE